MGGSREECRRFLDEWDDRAFEDLQSGHRLAAQGLEMVRELGSPPDFRGRALANLGSSFRAGGELDRATEIYEEVSCIYETLILDPDLNHAQKRQVAIDQADLDRRKACLWRDQRRYPGALEKATAAEIVFLAANDVYNVGRARLARGTIYIQNGHPEEAIPHLGSALTCFEPNKHDNAAYAAAHNLQIALTDTEPDPERLEETLRQVTEGRLSRASRRPSRQGSVSRQLMGHRRRTLPDAKARGLQGRILALLAQHDDAARLLESAREDLIHVGACLDAAVVDVELAGCYLWYGSHPRWERLEELAREALELLAPFPNMPEALAALQLWHAAVAARSLKETRELIERCRVLLVRPGQA